MTLIAALLVSVTISFASEDVKPPVISVAKPGPCSSPPNAQVVNNSGVTIYQVKVGKVLFQENLAYCTDGCSTGFIEVKEGSNQIYVKRKAASPWVRIGSLGTFEKCRHYAVNMKMKGRMLCAELFERKDTTPTFNDDTTKQRIAQTCKTGARLHGLTRP